MSGARYFVVFMPPMNVCASGTLPLNSAPEKSNPGFCSHAPHPNSAC